MQIVWASVSGTCKFEFQLYHALAVHHQWVGTAFLSLSFLVSKVGMVTASLVYYENYEYIIESVGMYQIHHKITQVSKVVLFLRRLSCILTNWNQNKVAVVPSGGWSRRE